MVASRPSLFLSAPHTRHGHVGALDGLRGLAVLIVLLSHATNAGMPPMPGLDLSGTGKSGVYLFFVLSSFLLTRALLDRPWRDLRYPRFWADYALRRILRIWPLYLVVLVLSAAITFSELAPWWHYRLDIAALVQHLQLRAGQSVLWSIPVEFKYYAVLPLVAVVFALLQTSRWWLEALVFVLSVSIVHWIWPPAGAPDNDVSLGPYLAVFLSGAYAAALHKRWGSNAGDVKSSLWAITAIVGFAALVLTIPAVWAMVSSTPVDYSVNHRWFIFFGVVWAAVLLAIANGPAWLRWLFVTRPMRLLGVVSFSAYLWHMVILEAMRWNGVNEGFPASWWFLGLTLGVSMASYLLFERPWRDVHLRRVRD